MKNIKNEDRQICKFGRLIPPNTRNPASYPEAGYLLLIAHYALPFGLKVEAINKMFGRILAKLKRKIKNFE